MPKPASESVQLGRRRMALALPLMAFGLVIPPVFAATGIHQASRTLMGTRVDGDDAPSGHDEPIPAG